MLLALASMGDENMSLADEHFDFPKLDLSVYGRSMDSVLAVLGADGTNISLLTRYVGKKLGGCHSYRSNLAVQDIIGEAEHVGGTVHEFMSKLSDQMPIAKSGS